MEGASDILATVILVVLGIVVAWCLLIFVVPRIIEAIIDFVGAWKDFFKGKKKDPWDK